MEGLVEEGKELLEEDAEPGVLDAGRIAAAQKVEHYEIASYGSARAWAERLGLGKTAQLLRETLDEEKATDEKLSELATAEVNEEAEEGRQPPGSALNARGRSEMRHNPLRFGCGFRVVSGDSHSQADQMTVAPGETEGGPDNRLKGSDQWLYVVSGTGSPW